MRIDEFKKLIESFPDDWELLLTAGSLIVKRDIDGATSVVMSFENYRRIEMIKVGASIATLAKIVKTILEGGVNV